MNNSDRVDYTQTLDTPHFCCKDFHKQAGYLFEKMTKDWRPNSLALTFPRSNRNPFWQLNQPIELKTKQENISQVN